MGVIVALVVGFAVWAFLNSAYFAIDDVRVEGTRQLTTEEVIELSAIPVGGNLITLSLDPIERSIEEHVWVHDADVRRDLPSTVVISIIERRPAGWVQDPDGAAVVAGDGTVLDRRAQPPDGLPELGGSAGASTVGERIGGLRDALRVAASMPRALLRAFRAIDPAPDGLLLSLREGGIVRYGAPVDTEEKNRALGELLRWAAREDISVHTIDVRVPSAPSLQPAGAGRGTPLPRG